MSSTLEDLFSPESSPPLQLPNGVLHDGVWYNYITAREMQGREFDMVGNKQFAREGITIRKIIQATVLSFMSDPDGGDEVTGKDAVALCTKMAMSDGAYVLSKIRTLTLGSKFSFSAACPACKHQTPFVVELDDQPVKFRDTPPEETFETTVFGKQFVLRTLTMKENPLLAKIQRETPERAESTRLFLQIVSADGKKVTSYNEVQSWPGRVWTELRNKLNEIEYGMDLVVENSCPGCSSAFKTLLPLASPGFFFPTDTPTT